MSGYRSGVCPGQRMSDELGVGSVDLALGWVDRPPDDLRQQRLFDETFVCIVRPGHPRIGNKPESSAIHFGVASGSRTLSRRLREFLPLARRQLGARTVAKGVDRKVALRVPDFLAVASIISSTDLLCVVPRHLAEVYAAYGQVRLVPLPVQRKLSRHAILAQTLRRRSRKRVAARGDQGTFRSARSQTRPLG